MDLKCALSTLNTLSLRELKAVAAKFRKAGILSVEIDGLKFLFNPEQPPKLRPRGKHAPKDEREFMSTEPTEEELLMFSVEGPPSPSPKE